MYTKSLVLTALWDNLAYRLKQKVNRFTRLAKGVSKSVLATVHARFRFRGVFKKSKFIVKKNEVHTLLQFRVLNYYNLVNNNVDYSKVLRNTCYTAKLLQLPMLSYLEFHIVAILLRSNFFENGYVTNALAKRKVFLLNGAIAGTTTTIRP